MKNEFNLYSVLSVLLIFAFGMYSLYILNNSLKEVSSVVEEIDELNTSIDSLKQEIDFRTDYIKERNVIIDSLLNVMYDEKSITDYWDSIRKHTPDSVADKQLREYLRRKRDSLL